MSATHVLIRQNQERRRFTQEITLGGIRVRLQVIPCQLTDRWYVSILDLDGNVLIGSIACVPGVNLLYPYRHLDIPQGALYCHSTDREPPTFSTLDVTARIYYQ